MTVLNSISACDSPQVCNAVQLLGCDVTLWGVEVVDVTCPCDHCSWVQNMPQCPVDRWEDEKKDGLFFSLSPLLHPLEPNSDSQPTAIKSRRMLLLHNLVSCWSQSLQQH